MSNDSATGGFLPLDTGLTAHAQEDAICETIAALSGLSGGMVRPRWQPKPPPQPAEHENWCAFGVIDEQPEGISLSHKPGLSVLHSEDRLTIMASFYGPEAHAKAKAVKLGLAVKQNREGLWRAGMVLVKVGGLVAAPDLVGQKWVGRQDLTVTLRRGDDVAVPIRDLVEAPVVLSGGALTVTANS
ncbi:hypothetical protein [Rhodospirillum sp. A1_3_36]|uniref:phage neck terminator protein n=1 Tax=Rhodospirillum sp. A1_3_36 TaxID=3391666 RepID=UPI0039A6DA6A